MWWDFLSQNVQCHSLADDHGKRCHETTFHTMCNITHSLLIMVKDVMRLPFTKCARSLTSCWSLENMRWDCPGHNMWNDTHKLWVIERNVMRLPFTECQCALNVTHFLWSSKKMWLDCLSHNVQCHSLPVGHRKRSDPSQTAFHKIWMSLTRCWL